MAQPNEIEVRRGALENAELVAVAELALWEVLEKTWNRMKIADGTNRYDDNYAEAQRQVKILVQKIGVIRDTLKSLPPKVEEPKNTLNGNQQQRGGTEAAA